jgi:4-hydroxy-tetrahydrodipicolinate reductase
MKIVLLGYGKMGKEIEAIAIQRGHEVVLKVDETNSASVSKADFQAGDVAIEFSTPDTALDNIYRCFDASLPVVVGTTGKWYEKLSEVKQHCTHNKQTLFYASNFSLGVNIFFKVNSFLAKIMNNFKDYDVEMEEIHHIHKLDKPSGTAISLANQLMEQMSRKKHWSIEKTTDPESLYIRDVREGEVPGTHIIKYTSAVDDIEIIHKAHNRKGFALGAVLAAEFIKDKKGIFTMDELLKL